MLEFVQKSQNSLEHDISWRTIQLAEFTKFSKNFPGNGMFWYISPFSGISLAFANKFPTSSHYFFFSRIWSILSEKGKLCQKITNFVICRLQPYHFCPEYFIESKPGKNHTINKFLYGIISLFLYVYSMSTIIPMFTIWRIIFVYHR